MADPLTVNVEPRGRAGVNVEPRGRASVAAERDRQVRVIVGAAAPGGDKHYLHTQGIPAAAWTITHNLGKWPSVTVVDTAGSELLADVRHLDQSSLLITFASATAGRAFMN